MLASSVPWVVMNASRPPGRTFCSAFPPCQRAAKAFVVGPKKDPTFDKALARVDVTEGGKKKGAAKKKAAN